MSRLSTLAFAIVVVIGAFHADGAVVQRHNVNLADYAVNRVTVIGDAFTAGESTKGADAKAWPTQVWRALAHDGIAVTPTVAAETGAGYSTRGNRGSLFEDLTVRAVKPSDALVIFFGSTHDMNVDLSQLSVAIYGTLRLARSVARSAKFIVIGPTWPNADPPPAVKKMRDVLSYQAQLAKATFIDPLAAGWFADSPDLVGTDGDHPTDAGHTYLASKLAPLIGNQLNPY